QGLGLARQIAHLTYRNDVELNQRFSCRLRSENYYEVTSYLDHQAKKLTARFDPHSDIALTRALRDHGVRRGRSSDLRTALADACTDNLVVSVSSDRLFPPEQVAVLAEALPGKVTHEVLESPVGHDGFLTETEKVSAVLRDFRLLRVPGRQQAPAVRSLRGPGRVSRNPPSPRAPAAGVGRDSAYFAAAFAFCLAALRSCFSSTG